MQPSTNSDKQTSPPNKRSVPVILISIFFLTGILASAFLFHSLTNRPDSRKKTIPGSPKKNSKVLPVAKSTIAVDAWKKASGPSVPKTGSQPNSVWNLSGIVSDNGHYAALLNGIIVEEGSIINGWTVDQITDQQVSLSGEGKKISLKLP